MSVSFPALLRAMLNPRHAFDWPRLFGAQPPTARHTPQAALSAAAIDVAAGDFRFVAHDVRFRLGAVTAIVGPNGAGKSTLLETLLGFRRGGRDVRVLDAPAPRFMRDPASLRRLGAQLQKVEYPDHARVDEIVALHRAMYRRADPNVTAALGIGELLGKPCRALSKGQRQRVDLYVALAHQPELAVLDEPFTGLDRRYAGAVSGLLRARAAAASVAMICHSADELTLVDDLVWVRDGGIRYQGAKEALTAASVGHARAALHCRDAAEARALRARLAALPGVVNVRAPQPLVAEAFGDATLHARVHALVGEQGIQHLELAPSTPEDLLRVCTEGPRDA
ncbi:ATP-binding cassette domain-containing protein [Burkholderia sp. TSV86]|uniref:ATP-binding cassette domain-containing protein n=1 Tax=Burkholderia sp. TSV86 TaxID=1385594 RepID=UPI00075B2AD1|nr:ATP-binding cassette domain-containing protein [Burkholderia sp. TSV86]KVE40208.1 phosphonate ABC transporter ATP-binding protein [Burkholderia sp. TSV86]